MAATLTHRADHRKAEGSIYPLVYLVPTVVVLHVRVDEKKNPVGHGSSGCYLLGSHVALCERVGGQAARQTDMTGPRRLLE